MSRYTRVPLAPMAAAMLLALSSQVPAARSQNLVVDGGFENPDIAIGMLFSSGPIGAWTFVQAWDPAALYEANSVQGANVTEGAQAFDMAGGGYTDGNRLFQTLPTVAGRTYRLTFDWGSEYDWGTYSVVTVGNLNELLVDDAFDQACTQTTFLQHAASYTFTASGNDTLTFTDVSLNNPPGPCSNFAGLCLDDVVVISCPNPPSCLTLEVRFDAVAAVVVERGIEVRWRTLLEDRTSGFVVERAAVEGGPWAPIAPPVDAVGPGRDYAVLDAAPGTPGARWWYRVVELTDSGRGDESPRVRVEVGAEGGDAPAPSRARQRRR